MGVAETVKGTAIGIWQEFKTGRSTSEHIYLLNNSAVSWASSKQSFIALSSTEAEYMALTLAVKEVLLLRTLFGEIGELQHAIEISTIYCDNQGAITLTKNPRFHGRSKHIDI